MICWYNYFDNYTIAGIILYLSADTDIDQACVS